MSSRYTPFLSDPFRSPTKKIRKVLGVDNVNGFPAGPDADYSDPTLLPSNNPYELSDLNLAGEPTLMPKVNKAKLAQQQTKQDIRSVPAGAQGVAKGELPRDINEVSRNLQQQFGFSDEDRQAYVQQYNIDPFKPKSGQDPTKDLEWDEYQQLSKQSKNGVGVEVPAQTKQALETFKQSRKPLEFRQVMEPDKEEETWGTWGKENLKAGLAGLYDVLPRATSNPMAGDTYEIDQEEDPQLQSNILKKDYGNRFGYQAANVLGNVAKIGAATPLIATVAPVAAPFIAGGVIGGLEGVQNEFDRQKEAREPASIKSAVAGGISEGLQNIGGVGVSKLGFNKFVSKMILNKTGSNALTLAGNTVANGLENVVSSPPISLAADYALDSTLSTDRLSRNPYRDPSSPEFAEAARNDFIFGSGIPFALEGKNAIEARKGGASVAEALGTIGTGETADNLIERQTIDSAIKKQKEIINSGRLNVQEKLQAKDNIRYLNKQKNNIGNPEQQAKLEQSTRAVPEPDPMADQINQVVDDVVSKKPVASTALNVQKGAMGKAPTNLPTPEQFNQSITPDPISPREQLLNQQVAKIKNKQPLPEAPTPVDTLDLEITNKQAEYDSLNKRFNVLARGYDEFADKDGRQGQALLAYRKNLENLKNSITDLNQQKESILANRADLAKRTGQADPNIVDSILRETENDMRVDRNATTMIDTQDFDPGKTLSDSQDFRTTQGNNTIDPFIATPLPRPPRGPNGIKPSPVIDVSPEARVPDTQKFLEDGDILYPRQKVENPNYDNFVNGQEALAPREADLKTKMDEYAAKKSELAKRRETIDPNDKAALEELNQEDFRLYDEYSRYEVLHRINYDKDFEATFNKIIEQARNINTKASSEVSRDLNKGNVTGTDNLVKGKDILEGDNNEQQLFTQGFRTPAPSTREVQPGVQQTLDYRGEAGVPRSAELGIQSDIRPGSTREIPTSVQRSASDQKFIETADQGVVNRNRYLEPRQEPKLLNEAKPKKGVDPEKEAKRIAASKAAREAKKQKLKEEEQTALKTLAVQDKKILAQSVAKLSERYPNAESDLIDVLSDEGVLRDNYDDAKGGEDGSKKIYSKYAELPLRYEANYGNIISKLSLDEYLGSLNAVRGIEGLPRLTIEETRAETNHYKDTVAAYKSTEALLKEEAAVEAKRIATENRINQEASSVIEGTQNKTFERDVFSELKDLDVSPQALKQREIERSKNRADQYLQLYPEEYLEKGNSTVVTSADGNRVAGKIGKLLERDKAKAEEVKEQVKTLAGENYDKIIQKAEEVNRAKRTEYDNLYTSLTTTPNVFTTTKLRNLYTSLALDNTGSPGTRTSRTIVRKVMENELSRRNTVLAKRAKEAEKANREQAAAKEAEANKAMRSPLLDQAGVKLIPKMMNGQEVYKVLGTKRVTGATKDIASGQNHVTYQDTRTGKWLEVEVPSASVKDKAKTDTREPLTGGVPEVAKAESIPPNIDIHLKDEAEGPYRDKPKIVSSTKPQVVKKNISMGPQGSMFGLSQQHVDTALRIGKELTKGLVGEGSTGKSKAVEELIKARKWLQDIFVAPTVSKGSQDAANIHRKYNGLFELESSRLEAIFDPVLKHTDNLSEAQVDEFIDNIEHGRVQSDPILEEIAKLTTEAIDAQKDLLKQENPDVLKKTYETYWPRMWSKESVDAARKIAAQMDNTLEGTKNFLKKRAFQDYIDGKKAGLKPVDSNPIRVMLLKLREMNRFISGRRIWKEAATDGLIKRFDPLSKEVPEGWVKIEDPLGTEAYYKPQWGKYHQAKRNLKAENLEGQPKLDGKLKPAMARVETGYYYAPPEVARIFNIGAKQGVGDIPMSDAYKYVGRMSNMMRVAWSTWHFNNIAADSMTTRLQLGLRNLREGTKSLLKGEFKQSGTRAGQGLKAVKDVVYNTASAPATIYSYFKQGKQLQRYLKYSDVTRADINNQQPRASRGLDSIGSRVQDLQAQLNQKKGAWDKIGDMIWGDPSKMPASMKADMDAQLNMLAEAGGRIAPDPKYASDTFSNKFKKALQERRPIGMAANIIPAISEFVSKPLMHHYIPSVKIGAFLDLYQKRMETMTPQEIANLDTADFGGKLWDQVEDRMGEVTYENYFFDKISKEAFHASVAFVGWRIGSTRQILGAGIDAARVPFKMIDRASKAIKPGGLDIVNKGLDIKGVGVIPGLDRLDEIFPLDRDNNKQLMTDRIEYFMSAGLGLVAYNTLMMAAMGQQPEEWKDLFYRPTGRMNPDGSKERLAPPTLAKDVYGVATQPIEYVKGGLRAEFAAFMGAYTNKDYQGFQINNPNDDPSQRLLDTTGYVLNQLFTPYSIANEQKRQKTANPYGAKDDSLLGTIHDSAIYNVAVGESLAPYYITRSSSQRLLGEYSRQQIPEGGISRDIKDKLDARRHIKDGLEVGDTAPLEQAIRDNYLTPEQGKSLLDTYQDIPDTARLNRLDVDKALNVYELATPDERKKFAPVMVDKIEALESKTPEERGRILERMKRLGVESHINDDLYKHNYDVGKEKIMAFTELEGNPNFRQMPKETQDFLKTKLAAVFNEFRFTKDKDLPNSITKDSLPYFQEAFKQFTANKEVKKQLVDALIQAGPALYQSQLAEKEMLGNKSTAGFDYEEDGTYEDSQE